MSTDLQRLIRLGVGQDERKRMELALDGLHERATAIIEMELANGED